jgi:hypothetical protein
VLTSSWNILAPPPAAHHLQTEILYTVTLLSYRNHVVNFNNVNTAAIPTIVVNVLCVCNKIRGIKASQPFARRMLKFVAWRDGYRGAKNLVIVTQGQSSCMCGVVVQVYIQTLLNEALVEQGTSLGYQQIGNHS